MLILRITLGKNIAFFLMSARSVLWL